MSRPELLIATSNEGKLRELRDLLKDLPFRLSRLTNYPHLKDIPETGTSFTENASIKAQGYARQAKVMTLSDDSGLEIEALDNAPGIFSARFLGEEVSYEIRNQKLLEELRLRKNQNRTARFVCAMAIADAKSRVLTVTTGICEGRIAESARGSGGFGYDPIFVPDGFEMTFGELPVALKNRISHRAIALERMREFLMKLDRVF